MVDQGSGVILMFGGYGDPPAGFNLGGLQVAFQALDALRRSLACELGPSGVRVVTLQTSGVLDALPDEPWAEQIREGTLAASALHRAATFEDVGDVAAFAASDKARTMTGTAFNITCGTTWD